MAQTIQAVRGMNDILPEQTPRWAKLELLCRDICARYAYQEIRLPIVESTHLFARGVGEVTDIVEKEMYTFEDRNGDSLSLRPEGTAVCVRACEQHSLLYKQTQRLWYMGPMFRHERPQKGRYRQFYQFGVEAFGMPDPAIDAELIGLSYTLWQELGILDKLTLQINTLGSSEARAAYREILVDYFTQHIDVLDDDSRRRLQSNPLRILDSKNPALAEVIAAAPQMLDHLDGESAAHFAALREMLDAMGIQYQVNPSLVRGLDYYNRTVFEWVTDQLGAQGTVCAGGRYDSLVEKLGGKPTPAIGFAIGLERLLLLLPDEFAIDVAPQVYVVLLGDAAQRKGTELMQSVRSALPQLRVETNLTNAGMKSQFKKADKSGAQIALVIGEQEVTDSVVTIKELRQEAQQQTVAYTDLIEFLQTRF